MNCNFELHTDLIAARNIECLANLSISGCCQPANRSLIRVTSPSLQRWVVDSREIVYNKEIDYNSRNTVTIADSISDEGIAVKGGVPKFTNQFLDREDAGLKFISDW